MIQVISSSYSNRPHSAPAFRAGEDTVPYEPRPRSAEFGTSLSHGSYINKNKWVSEHEKLEKKEQKPTFLKKYTYCSSKFLRALLRNSTEKGADSPCADVLTKSEWNEKEESFIHKKSVSDVVMATDIVSAIENDHRQCTKEVTVNVKTNKNLWQNTKESIDSNENGNFANDTGGRKSEEMLIHELDGGTRSFPVNESGKNVQAEKRIISNSNNYGLIDRVQRQARARNVEHDENVVHSNLMYECDHEKDCAVVFVKNINLQNIAIANDTYDCDGSEFVTKNVEKLNDSKSHSFGASANAAGKTFQEVSRSERGVFTAHKGGSVLAKLEERNPRLVLQRAKQDACSQEKSELAEVVTLLQSVSNDEDEGEYQDVHFRTIDKLAFECERRQVCDMSDIFLCLDELEKEYENISDTDRGKGKFSEFKDPFPSPTLEQLLNRTPLELAQDVLSLKIQLEDQRKGIHLLKEALEKVKGKTRETHTSHQRELEKVNSEATAAIQRHQQLIGQLISEKKKLNDTITKLLVDLKQEEEKFKKNMKTMQERHVIEIKRAKDAQAAADKIKRDKWMESKTKKIKEMTVKGLEPELARLTLRQQQEMTELRNLQRAEIEALEMKATRRTSEMLDNLRLELMRERENAIMRETNNLRVKMEKNFEEERNKFDIVHQRLKDQIKREEEKVAKQEADYKQMLLEHKREDDRERQKIALDFKEKVEEIRQQYMVEVKNLKESLEKEKETWMSNYKKQEAEKFIERENELHKQYKRERDKEIEVVIDMLEKESEKLQVEMNAASENKMKRLKDKLESEIKEIEASEAIVKTKYANIKSQVTKKDELISELNSHIRQLKSELAFVRKSCADMTSERVDLKNIIRKEFEVSMAEAAEQKAMLEKTLDTCKQNHLQELAKKDEITESIKAEMQKELARVYSRIKQATNKKDMVIERLRGEYRAAVERCQQLELLLDKQRRNLLLQ